MQADTQTADRLAILEQIARYSYAWDDRDLEAYVALFVEDASFVVDPELPGGPSVNATGHEAIRTWARERMDARKPGVQVRHHQSGTLFDELGEDQAPHAHDAADLARRPGRRASRQRHLLRRVAPHRRGLAFRNAHPPPRLPRDGLSPRTIAEPAASSRVPARAIA